jgi:hypothetical protein
MDSKTDTKADTTNAPTEAVPPVSATSKDDADFVRIITQRYMYNAEECKDFPLVGHLINRLPMPPIKGRNWDAFLVRLTRPCKGVDRDGVLVDVGVGEEMLIPATFTLAAVMGKAATNEAACYEVKIQPTKKIDIGGGQEMWEYELAAKPNPRKRGSFGLAAVLGQDPPQLTAGDNDSPF